VRVRKSAISIELTGTNPRLDIESARMDRDRGKPKEPVYGRFKSFKAALSWSCYCVARA